MERMKDTCPLVIAHRGYSARYPENTIASFVAAADTGALMVELDVTLSRDRKVVVIHDDHLDRTTTGSGLVGDHTLAALKELDAGSWFDARFSKERIPLLEEVMAVLLPDTMINVEIKSSAFEAPPPDDAIERQVLRLIRQFDAFNVVLVSSFEIRFLERLRRFDPSVRVALISETPIDRDAFGRFCNFDAYSWHPDNRILTQEQLDLLHGRGIRVYPYTVNSISLAQSLLSMGVDGIITDDPRLIRPEKKTS